MKSIITIFMLLVSTSSFAGLPAADPAVAKLRDEFAVARVPTLQDLRINEFWDCTELGAKAGDYSVTKVAHENEFRSVDGIVLNDSSTAYVKTLAFTKDGLSGSFADTYQYIETIRITTDGDLVEEWANNPTDPTVALQAISLVNPNYFAESYSVCSPAK